MNSAQLLPAIHELFSKHPAFWHHVPWELQWILYAVNYTDELEDEAVIGAAIEAARGDHPGWRPAA